MSNRTLLLASSPLHSYYSLSPNPNPRSNLQKQPIHRSLRSSFRSLSIDPSSTVWRRWRCYSSLRDSSSSLDLPLLPFQSDEVLIPAEAKTLDLYEARFLALLEESLLVKKKLFVHFVLEPVLSDRSSSEASFAARFGCLVLIENVERLEIGALVSIRGIGRVNIVDITQTEPYLRGVVVPVQDEVPDYKSEIDSKLIELKQSLSNLHNLQIKLKVPKDELLQTSIKNSLTWAEREAHENCGQAFFPTLAERLSFAALQPVSGCSPSELLSLQKEKLQAMDLRDTSERLKIGIKSVKLNIAMVAAKLAIQSLEL